MFANAVVQTLDEHVSFSLYHIPGMISVHVIIIILAWEFVTPFCFKKSSVRKWILNV